MAGCRIRGANPVGVIQQKTKFHRRVAQHAGDGGNALQIAFHKRLHNLLKKRLADIGDLQRNPQLGGGSASVC